MIDIRPLKSEALKYPEPLKSMIQSEEDNLPEGEFVRKLMKWRQKAREIDALRAGEKS